MTRIHVPHHIMRMLRFFQIFTVLIVLAACTGSEKDLTRFYQIPDTFKESPSEWLRIAENKNFLLRIHGKSAIVEVTNKQTGKVWLSNPIQEDPRASGINRNNLQSQFRIEYYTDKSLKKSMTSYGDSVALGQFQIRPMDSGAELVYTLGKVDHIKLIPKIISAERYEAILENSSDPALVRQLDRQYELVTLSKVRTEEKRKELLDEYPQLEQNDLYVFSDIENKAVLEQVEQGFIQGGYTLEDLLEDNRENNVEGEAPNTELFSVTLRYTLLDDGLSVSVPTDRILYHPTFPISMIRVFEFFGASYEGVHKGYMFVPDGSGALIELDSKRKNTNLYIGRVYGNDPAIPVKEYGMKQSDITLPIFGMKQDDDAFLAVIDEGEAHASIYADIAGKINSFNYVGSEFSLLPATPVTLESLQGNKYVNTYQKELVKGELRLTYHFLSGEKADYVGMAEIYRKLLFPGNSISAAQRRMSVLVDFYMGINKRKQFAGISYNGIETLTSYRTAKEILDDIHGYTHGNVAVNLIGWQKKAYQQDLSFKPDSRYGNHEALADFITYTEEKGDPLFFEGSVLRVYDSGLLDGYNQTLHTTKLLNRKIARLYPVNLATRTQDASYPPFYLASPHRQEYIFNSALKNIVNHGLPGFAFRFAGNSVHSDFLQRDEVPRQEAIAHVEGMFEKLREENVDILVYSGNAYSLKDVSFISDVEISSNEYVIAYRNIPFIQLVLSGNLPYAGKAINLSDYERKTFLKHVESGAIPHFTLISEDNSLVVHTHFDYLYSVEYDRIADRIKEWTTELDGVRKKTDGSRMIDHSFLDENVVAVSYDNGTKLIINYGPEVFQYQDTLISGEDYTVVFE